MANNSISQIIRQFLEMNQNSLETYEKISEAITTDKQTVTIDLFDENGALKTVQVPAFGYLKREIERLDTNMKSLSGLGQGDAAVRMKDGTFRQIQKSKLKTPAKAVSAVAVPTEFSTKSNYFFESFLNPLLTIKLDVAGQVPADTEKIKVKRYLIDSQAPASAEWFDQTIKGSDALEINNLVSLLETNNVAYNVDEEVIDAPVRSTQYFGSFDVSKVRTVQRNVVVDGVSVTKSVKLYSLNKFTYSDSNKNLNDTELLKVGDELLVNSGSASTKYRVVALSTDTLEAELLLIEGYEPILVGAAQLKIYKNKEAYNAIDINVGFDERVVVFIKPVDPDSNLEAEIWSPGAAFYTNDLLITLPNGQVQTLAQYYKEEVADFGQMIKALKDDSIPPATLGVTPDAPTLEANNFKVVQINTHLTENDAFNKIKKLNSNKVEAEENIKRLDDDIAARRAKLATTKYPTLVAKDRENNELTTALNRRAAESKLYTSLVNEIVSTSNSSAVKSITPKYRVRGFWSIPTAKLAAETMPQEIVQFKVQYRYLSTDGNPAAVSQIEFSDRDKNKTAVFSNWNEILTPVRKRVKDETTGKYYWDLENVEDGQAININQLDIAIQEGEVVEIRIKSISEAGWPANPVESDWSDVTRIEFPTGTQASQAVTTIVDATTQEVALVKMMDELESKGFYTHIADSFQVNEKYFAHEASSISSGFLSPEQSPISLMDKLIAMQQELDALRAQIDGVKGELAIKLEFEDGTSQVLQNNTVTQIFAGYYTDEIKDLQIKKGHIVTKTFKLILENTKATKLELISRLIGNRTLPSYNSGTDLTAYNGFGVEPGSTPATEIASDSFYTNNGKYDLVPIQYQNMSGVNTGLSYFNDSPYQSAQLRGQYVYSRYKNVAADSILYATDNIDSSWASGYNSSQIDYEYELTNINQLKTDTGFTGSGYMFDGFYDLAGNPSSCDLVQEGLSADYDNGLFLHVNHPELVGSTWTGGANNIYGNGRFVQAKTANIRANQPGGNQQSGFYYDSVLNRTIKMSFEPNDQYMLGGKSCGAYLFMSPLSTSSLSVDADNNQGVRQISGNSSISVDIIFQYRMTDYAGTSDSATGYVGGISSTALSNLSYSKRIGIDIFDSQTNEFHIDLEVFAKYKA
jgi:hypothetical protein